MEPLFIRATLTLILLFIGSMFILFAMLFDMEQERNIGMYLNSPIFTSGRLF